MMSIISGIPSWLIPIIILIISVIGLAIIFERAWVLYKEISNLKLDDRNTLNQLIKQKDYEQLLALCYSKNHPAYKMLAYLLERRQENSLGSVLESVIEEATLKTTEKLQQFLPSLGTIATVSPMLGLLGTVTGMIKSFSAFEQSTSRSTELMGGIDEALITTALGLLVAIPSLVMHNHYVRRANSLLKEAELITYQALESLRKS